MNQVMAEFLIGYTLTNQGKFSYLFGLGFTISCWLLTTQIQGLVCFVFEKDVIVRKVCCYGCKCCGTWASYGTPSCSSSSIVESYQTKEIVSKRRKDKLEKVS
jgi:hypothetical protein